MKSYNEVLTISVFLTHAVPFCVADVPMMLFKFGMVPTHYENYTEKEYSMDSDRLNYLPFRERKALCDAVVNAKQFSHVYNPKYYDKIGDNTYTSLKKLPVDDVVEGPNSSSSFSKLKRRECTIRFRSNSRFPRIICVQCVNTKKVKWFVALSLVDEFVWYLLEPGSYFDEKPVFRITGLFEPSASVKEDVSFSYFYSQFRDSKNEMESLCELGQDDRLRLCSAVFAAVDEENTLREVNYVKVQRRCRKCLVKGKNDSHTKVDVLPCTMMAPDVGKSLKPFFLLADSRESGAVIVFYPNEKRKGLPTLSLYTRVSKLGALLHPIGVKNKQVKSTNLVEVEKGTKKVGKAGKQRKRKKKQDYSSEDTDTEVSEQEFDFDATGDEEEEEWTEDADTDAEVSEPEFDSGSTGDGRREGSFEDMDEDTEVSEPEFHSDSTGNEKKRGMSEEPDIEVSEQKFYSGSLPGDDREDVGFENDDDKPKEKRKRQNLQEIAEETASDVSTFSQTPSATAGRFEDRGEPKLKKNLIIISSSEESDQTITDKSSEQRKSKRRKNH